MSSLLIITGPPGAGKSTVASRVAERLDPSVLVAGDAFFEFLATGAIEPWLPAAADQNEIVTEAGALATARFVTAGYATVYDGIVGPWLLNSFLAAANLEEVDYAILLPSIERCITRVQQRTGHGFSDVTATRKMHLEFTSATIAERHIISEEDEAAGHQEEGEAPGMRTAERLLELVDAGVLRYQPGGTTSSNC